MNMSILVTGGFGLLGSWVGFYLGQRGKKVILLDLRERYLDYLEGVKDSLTFFRGDVLSFPHLSQVALAHPDIEGIIHTPAAMATPEYWNNPYQGTILNLVGTLNVLELARLFRIPRVVYVSSGAVYGETKDNPREDTHPIAPSDLYGASKGGAELLTLQYGNHYGLDTRVVRPYFFFGPGVLPSESTFLFRNLLGPLEGLQGLSLERGKDQRLGFTYVKDTAWGTVLAYEKENPRFRVFNIASDQATGFGELARLAQKYSDTPTEVTIGPGKLFPRGETLDITRAREELGFAPRYGIEEAVVEYAHWVREELRRRRKNTP
jgi:nucleoside-diphosphate-sugar epimerase